MGGLEVVDSRYPPLWERAQEVLGADPRVVSLEPGGSVANGTADRWSDLDIEVVARAEDHESFLADWPAWLSEITPTVFARTPIAPFIINVVTPEGLTLDFAVFRGEKPTFPPTSGGYTVGALSSRRFTDVRDALEYAVAEQLRGLTGPFITLVQRDEHMRHLTGVPHLLGLLTTVFLAETGAPPPGKHWNRTFTDEQRAAVGGLPPVRATRDDIIAFGLDLAELLITRARPLFKAYDLEWPTPLAAAARTRIEDSLKIRTGDWLY
jgi:hypothetical protein